MATQPDLNIKCYCGSDIVGVKTVNNAHYYKCVSSTKHFSFSIFNNRIVTLVLRTDKHDLSLFEELKFFRIDAKEVEHFIQSVNDLKSLLSSPDLFLENYLLLT